MSGTISGVTFRPSGPDVTMTVFRGKSLRFDVVWGGAAPIDISGWTAQLQARNRAGELMMELSSANGGVTNGGVNGTFTFTAAPEVTRNVDAPGYYEVELTTSDGLVYRAISGLVTFQDEVVL